MNKLIVFMLGSCSTFSIHLGLMYVNWWDMLFTHAMSLVGGVVSAVIVPLSLLIGVFGRRI